MALQRGGTGGALCPSVLQPQKDDQDAGSYLRVSKWAAELPGSQTVGNLLPAKELKSLEFIIHDSKWDEEMQ